MVCALFPKPEREGRGGKVAQLVEQRTENPRVVGSIPTLATIFFCLELKDLCARPRAGAGQTAAGCHGWRGPASGGFKPAATLPLNFSSRLPITHHPSGFR
jgi:hypothetical protein